MKAWKRLHCVMAYYSTYSGKSFCFANFPSGTYGEGEAWIPSQKMKRRKRTKQSQSQLMVVLITSVILFNQITAMGTRDD